MKQSWVLYVTCTITTEVKSYTPSVNCKPKTTATANEKAGVSPGEGLGWEQIYKMDISESNAKLENVLKPWRCSSGFTTKSLYKIHSPDDLHLLNRPDFKSHWKPLPATELKWFSVPLLNAKGEKKQAPHLSLFCFKLDLLHSKTVSLWLI